MHATCQEHMPAGSQAHILQRAEGTQSTGDLGIPKSKDGCIPAPAPTQKCKIHTWGSFRCRGFCQGLGGLTVQFRLHPADAIHFRLQNPTAQSPRLSFHKF